MTLRPVVRPTTEQENRLASISLVKPATQCMHLLCESGGFPLTGRMWCVPVFSAVFSEIVLS